MTNQNPISIGARFIPDTASDIINMFGQSSSSGLMEETKEKIKKMMKEKGSLEVPEIIQELHITADLALMALKQLREQGYIRYESE